MAFDRRNVLLALLLACAGCGAERCSRADDPLTCDDGLTCTVGDRRAGGRCIGNLREGFCRIEGRCYRDMEEDPRELCRVCDADRATDAWTGGEAGALRMEVGTAYVPSAEGGEDAGASARFAFLQRYTNPIVFTLPPARGIVRAETVGRAGLVVQSVASGSASLAQRSLDAAPAVRAPVLVMEADDVTLPDGTRLLAGKVTSSTRTGDPEWTAITFEPPFARPPLLLTMLQSAHSPRLLVSTVRNVTESHAELAIESDGPLTRSEAIGYLAVSTDAEGRLRSAVNVRSEDRSSWFDLFGFRADGITEECERRALPVRLDDVPLVFGSLAEGSGWLRGCHHGRDHVGLALGRADAPDEGALEGGAGARDAGARDADVLVFSRPFVADRECAPTRRPRTFRVWAMSDPHIGSDANPERSGGAPRESLGEPIRQSQGEVEGAPAFAWDIGLVLGDVSGFATPASEREASSFPPDLEGRLLQAQLARLDPDEHPRGDVYFLVGNHDAGEPAPGHDDAYRGRTDGWFRHWVDPLGTSTHPPEEEFLSPGERRFPIEGAYSHYAFDVGNVRFLMLSDVNYEERALGGRSGRTSGQPAGKIGGASFDWWRARVEREGNDERILVTAHHHMLQETTTATGRGEGLARRTDFDGFHFHGSHLDPAERERRVPVAPTLRAHLRELDAHASYLAVVGDRTDPRIVPDYLDSHRGALDIWLGGHTHLLGPEDEVSDRGPAERAHGDTFFINVAGLTEHHYGAPVMPAMSRLLVFTEGRREVWLRYYLHSERMTERRPVATRDFRGGLGFFVPADTWFTVGAPFVPPE